MKKIVAINCSPRSTWNTATLVREAAKGAEGKNAFSLGQKWQITSEIWEYQPMERVIL